MCGCVGVLSCVQLFVTPWTVTCHALLSMKCSRQKHWSRLPSPIPGNLPDPGIKLTSLSFPTFPGGFFTASAFWVQLQKPQNDLVSFPRHNI